jgi:hypothetical protein
MHLATFLLGQLLGHYLGMPLAQQSSKRQGQLLFQVMSLERQHHLMGLRTSALHLQLRLAPL